MEKILGAVNKIDALYALLSGVFNTIHSFFVIYLIVSTLVYVAAAVIWFGAVNKIWFVFKGSEAIEPSFKVPLNLNLIIQLTLYLLAFKIVFF